MTAHRRAFTLVEIMVVVVVIGLLAAMAIAAFQRVRERSLASRMANDIRQCEAAFQRYCMDNGSWPPPGAPGVMPAGMAGYLPDTYTQITAVGGNFSWSGPAAKLYLINTPASADVVMQRVDALLDDGNIATGDIIKTGTGYTVQLH
jgi:prepilin-type N-terminal cleavage/methylation domain-containing protein